MRLIPCTMGEDKLSAAQVAKLLFENIVRFFGVPKKLVHDHDPRFTAHLWHELWHILGTKTSASTTFHPQSDGQSEHTNRIFEQILHAHIHNKPPSAWLDALPFTEFAITVQLAKALAIHPFSCCMGRKSLCPSIMHLQTHLMAQCNLQPQAH